MTASVTESWARRRRSVPSADGPLIGRPSAVVSSALMRRPTGPGARACRSRGARRGGGPPGRRTRAPPTTTAEAIRGRRSMTRCAPSATHGDAYTRPGANAMSMCTEKTASSPASNLPVWPSVHCVDVAISGRWCSFSNTVAMPGFVTSRANLTRAWNEHGRPWCRIVWRSPCSSSHQPSRISAVPSPLRPSSAGRGVLAAGVEVQVHVAVRHLARLADARRPSRARAARPGGRSAAPPPCRASRRGSSCPRRAAC